MARQIYFLGFEADTAEELKKLTCAIFGTKYNIEQIRYISELKKIDSKTEQVVILYIEKLNLEQRKFIWQFRTNYPLVKMVLCSKDLLVANFSWQINVLFFLPHPISRRAVSLMYKKIEESFSSPKIRIKLNYQGGFDLVTSDEVCFCEGDGNYTTVHLTNSKSVMLSKKIKDIFQRLSPFPEIVRIGKSYIVNINNIIRIDESTVYFKAQNNNSSSFKLSPVYLKRLKEHLLWFTA